MTFIQEQLKHYTLTQLCTALKFPRSTYYKALVCVPSNRKMEHQEFSKEVKRVFDESKGIYGAVKICRSLNDNGMACSLKRVQRHMKAQELRSKVVKKYNHHANKGTVPNDKENILNRDFKAVTINQKWCTDITYIHGHPCLRLYPSHYRADSRLALVRNVRRRAHIKSGRRIDLSIRRPLFISSITELT